MLISRPDTMSSNAADHCDLDTGTEQLPDAEAVLRRKRLGLDAVIRQVETPVREYAIDVEAHQFQVAREVPAAAHAHITPARNRS